MNTTQNTPLMTVKLSADNADQWRKRVVDLAHAVGADNVVQICHRSDFLEGYVTLRTGPRIENPGCIALAA